MNEYAEKDGEVVVAPKGNIAAEKVAVLRTDLLDLVSRPEIKVVIDMNKVEIVDSMGVGVLITAYNSLKKAGGSMRMVNVSGDIRRMFSIMRLDKHFGIE